MRMFDLPSLTACVPNAAGPLNFTPTSSDVWGDVENSGERFGKAQSATPRNQGQPTSTVAFAKLEGERWLDEWACRGHRSSSSGSPLLFSRCSHGVVALIARGVCSEWRKIRQTHSWPLSRI